jgi:hypothetical protein
LVLISSRIYLAIQRTLHHPLTVDEDRPKQHRSGSSIIEARAVSQLLWSQKVRAEWFSLRENHERLFRFGLHQLRNRYSVTLYSDLLEELDGAGLNLLSVFAADPLSVVPLSDEPLSVPLFPEEAELPSEAEAPLLPWPVSCDLAEEAGWAA